MLNTLTEEILIYTSNCGEFIESFVVHNGSTGMTCDQAISYLSGFYKSQNNLKAIPDDSYLGTRYEQASGYDDPTYSNTINIHSINNDGTVLFSLSFLRLRGFDKLVAYLIDERTGIFYDVRSGFSGLLDFSDGNVILSIEDTPNFYFDHSSVHFLEDKECVFFLQDKSHLCCYRSSKQCMCLSLYLGYSMTVTEKPR